MRVQVDWNWLPADDLDDPAWRLSGVVYAYLAPPPHPNEVLYIGKAWGTTIRQR